MCYAIPGKLARIEGSIGIVDYYGERRKILLDDNSVKPGDYVFAQGGILIRKIPESEAEEILKTWKEIFVELQQVDEALSKINANDTPDNVLAVLQKVNHRKTLTREELKALFSLKTTNECAVLYEVANHVRQRSHGNASCVHGIIEFSNACSLNCHYCGIRRDRDIQRYRMSVEEILCAAQRAVEDYGFNALVLQSGEDYSYDDDLLEFIVKKVRQLGVLVFVSIGSRSSKTYQQLYEAGARAALLRFETSNPKLFESLRPGTKWEKRISLIEDIKNMGYVLATGFLLGLPGETIDDVVNNILLTKQLNPEMVSFGPLIPVKETPLENSPKVEVDDVLKAIAVTRLADANANILVTTALETLDKDARKRALLAGANSMMINVTPSNFKSLYSIYDRNDEEIAESVVKTVKLLHSLGRAPTDLGR